MGWFGFGGSASYGVRSAVTNRAWRIAMVLEPATRRQEASKFGQAFCEQFGPAAWMWSRSALARACGVEASTWGAKPGRTVRAAATNAATATAERALIMTVPCHWALAARFVALTDTKRPFRDVFAKLENGFIPPEFCFVANRATKQCRPALETSEAPKWFGRLQNIKMRAFAAARGTRAGLPGRPGRGRRGLCPVSRFIPAHSTPSPTAIRTWSGTPSCCVTG